MFTRRERKGDEPLWGRAPWVFFCVMWSSFVLALNDFQTLIRWFDVNGLLGVTGCLGVNYFSDANCL